MYSKKVVERRLEQIEKQLYNDLQTPFQLRRYSIPEVDSWNQRLNAVADLEGNPKRALTDEESQYIFNQITLCKWDFEYFLTRFCWISSDRAGLTRITPRKSQLKILAKWAELEEQFGRVALIIAKARRVGATVMGEAAVAHHVMLRSQAKGLIASCEPTNSLELFKIQNRIYDNLPWWMKPRMTGKVKGEHLYFEPPLDSDITIGHGAQKNPMGQGVRLDAVHLTEASTWLGIGTEQIDDDIGPAWLSSKAPSKIFVVESTGESAMDADGMWFKTEYYKSKQETGWKRALFLSWYDVPEVWSEPSIGVTFSETTLAAAERIKRETGYECTKDQLAWYQIHREDLEAKGKLSSFLREYSSNDEECFAFAQHGAWSIETITEIRTACPFPDAPGRKSGKVGIFEVDLPKRKLAGSVDPQNWNWDPNCRLFLYKDREPGFTYVMGVDVAYGLDGCDYGSIFINRVGTRFGKDEQVAEFTGICLPDDLASACWILGHLYYDSESGLPAQAAIETNGPGLTTQTELQKMGYSNFYLWRYENRLGGGMTKRMGWITSSSTRPLITRKIVEAVRSRELIINSPFFADEMKTFVNMGVKSRGTAKPYEYLVHADGAQDDRIFAGAIAYYVSHDYDIQNIADERRKLAEEEERLRANVRPKSYQSDPEFTSDSMYEDFESRLWG